MREREREREREGKEKKPGNYRDFLLLTHTIQLPASSFDVPAPVVHESNEDERVVLWPRDPGMRRGKRRERKEREGKEEEKFSIQVY